MNRLTPYEKALSGQLNDLSIPDVDVAWKDMEELLGKEKDDNIIIPPPQKQGCGLWGLLLGLLLLGIGSYLFYKHDQKNIIAAEPVGKVTLQNKSNVIETHNRQDVKLPADTTQQGRADKNSENISLLNSRTTATGQLDHKTGITKNQSKEYNTATTKTTKSASHKSDAVISQNNPHESAINKNEQGHISNKHLKKYTARQHSVFLKGSKDSKKDGTGINKEITYPGYATPRKNKQTSKQKSGIKISAANPEDDLNDTTAMQNDIKKSSNIATDTIAIKLKNDTPVINKNVTEPVAGSTKKDTKKFYFSAGVAVNQGLPINGETISTINNYGRKQALSDYIPSLYFRFYKEKKWFIQSEFRYGAPQYVKEYIYKTNVKVDTFQNVTRTSYFLKKTYYHQLPVSFNYLILPGWSLGTGIMYNKFTGAVSENTTRRSVPGTVNDTLISVVLVNDKKDSSFVKNSFQWLLESQYKWRRFSIGARYAQGLQPYIKYTDPVTLLPASKKNNSIHLFIRYEIWNSRKKMAGNKN